MKKSIVKLGLITALSASLFGFTYEIKQGWQQLGALEDLNVSDLKAFNDKCVNYLWFYDNNDSSNPQWKLHIANGNDYDYCGETLTSLKKGQGFWANAKADCNISIGTTPNVPCVSDMPAPPDLEKPECITCKKDDEITDGTYIASSIHETCNLVLENGESKGDGVYLMDKDGTPFKAYCDMTNDGGGWTLIVRTDRSFTNEVDSISLSDPASNRQLLKKELLDIIIPASNKIFRSNNDDLSLKMYVYDKNPFFQIGTWMWQSNATEVKCSKDYSFDTSNSNWVIANKNVANSDTLVGDHVIGNINGWLLWHLGDTYNANDMHPCPTGKGAYQGSKLINIYVK